MRDFRFSRYRKCDRSNFVVVALPQSFSASPRLGSSDLFSSAFDERPTDTNISSYPFVLDDPDGDAADLRRRRDVLGTRRRHQHCPRRAASPIAFTAAVVTYELQNPYISFVCGIISGAALAFVFAVAVIKFEADQVVTGFAVSLLMIGLPAVISAALYDSAGSTEQIEESILTARVW